MTRKFVLTIAMLAVGVGLLVAAGFASAASSGNDQSASAYVKKGGTLRLSKSTDVDYVDPALAYFTDTFGSIGYATCAKLYSYPDKTGAAGAQVVPEVAAGAPTISANGRTYTIKLKTTYRFHNGTPVRAANYVEAFNRDANPKMQSPATSYMTEIVGAEAVISGKASKISGIRAVGKWRLQIRLTKSLPDFVARLTMPFFCPVRVGEAIEPDGVNNPLGSGPYYVSERVVNRQITLLKNKFYKGPRPANLDKIVWTIGPSLEACRLSTERNQTDWCVDGVPPTSYKDIADKYGVNRQNGQFYFNTALGTSYFALNHDRAAFKGARQLPLKKAINTAIDRPALVRASGYLGGKRTDQILPPALTKDVKLFPLQGANPTQAKTLYGQAGVKPDKLVLYTATTGARVIRAQVLQFNLKQIGVEVDVKQFARAVQHEKCATRGEAFDLCDEGWLVDYADPVTFFEPLLNGKNIQQTSNSNESYFNDPRYNAKIEQTAALPVGAKRNAQWAALDADIMKNAVPWAPFLNITIRDFVSSSTGCYLYHPVWEFDLAAACKK
jgi:ABC-type oligopeptide transport system substrate-binding subunit